MFISSSDLSYSKRRNIFESLQFNDVIRDESLDALEVALVGLESSLVQEVNQIHYSRRKASDYTKKQMYQKIEQIRVLRDKLNSIIGDYQEQIGKL